MVRSVLTWLELDEWRQVRGQRRRYRCVQAVDGVGFAVVTMDLVDPGDPPSRRADQDRWYLQQLVVAGGLELQASLEGAIAEHDAAFDNAPAFSPHSTPSARARSDRSSR